MRADTEESVEESTAEMRLRPEASLSDRERAAANEAGRAVQQLERALGELPERGAQRYREEVARELRRLGRRERRVRALDEPGPGLEELTARQRQVAELAAQGKKNREIAADLYLSETTVEKHLMRVFDKLGVSSRTAVAVIVDRSKRQSSD